MDPSRFHATTIVSVRRDGKVAVGGDGQVTLGNTVMKANARKVRRLGREGQVLAGFAGAAADAFTLFELFESKLEKHGQLTRAAVELAKDWRTERRLGKLEALQQREGVGGAAGEADEHPPCRRGAGLGFPADPADLGGVVLDDGVAEGDLAVAADGDLAVSADGEDGRGVDEGLGHGGES